MLKMTLIVVATALVAFMAGVWTKSTVLATGTRSAVASVSPYELHLKVRPGDLPAQAIDSLY